MKYAGIADAMEADCNYSDLVIFLHARREYETKFWPAGHGFFTDLECF